MKATQSPKLGLWQIQPDVYPDSRGYFFESFNEKKYSDGEYPIDPYQFVQDNVSYSYRGVFRGLHLQREHPQAKLVACLDGSILDFAVDVRKDSETFGVWEQFHINSTDKNQLYIPEGFAHGFFVLSETALIQYKCSDYFYPADGVTINHCSVGICLPYKPTLSEKDQKSFMTLDQYKALL